MRPLQLGRYTLLERIAIGGQAAVFLARFDGAGAFTRLVAVKRPLPERGATGRQRLLEEARLMSRIVHPNVIAALDAGLDSHGAPFLVLEWVDGVPLATVLQRERLPTGLAGYIALSVARAIAEIHRAADEHGPLRIVHRDITPGNVLLGTRGEVKLADFGIAKARGGLVPTTEPGRGRGTRGYAAPEQIRGERCDARTDVYALGKLLQSLSLRGAPALLAVGDALVATDPDSRPANFTAIAADIARACPPNADAAHDLGAWISDKYSPNRRRNVTVEAVAQQGLVTTDAAPERAPRFPAIALAATAALLPPLLVLSVDRATRAPATSGPAQLVLRSMPDRASVFLDGSAVGVTPLALHTQSGTHRLRLTNALLKADRELPVELAVGETKQVDVDLSGN